MSGTSAAEWRFTVGRALSLWLLPVLWAGVIFYFSSLPDLRVTENDWDFVLRKIAHLTVFGILALLLWRALRGSVPWSANRLVWGAFYLTAAYAATDEVHQHFVPGRFGTMTDVLIDCLGAWLALRGLDQPWIKRLRVPTYPPGAKF